MKVVEYVQFYKFKPIKLNILYNFRLYLLLELSLELEIFKKKVRLTKDFITRSNGTIGASVLGSK